jgi:predicted nucleotidyltransferase component of viral defense system
MSRRNLSASVRARLLARAKERGENFSLVLTRYAMERLLYRLGASQYANRFMLKGALLFELWYSVSHRATGDIDLLGFGSSDPTEIEALFREIIALPCEDGIEFLPDSICLQEIREEARYDGIRLTLKAVLDSAKIPVQIDIGFGDAVTPAAEETDYPVILPDLPSPHLCAYPRYTVVAEKFEALTVLGLANSRMKDFFDLRFMIEHTKFDGTLVCEAVKATFTRRGSKLPLELPLALTDVFTRDRQKRTQWNAFFSKNHMETLDFDSVIALLARFFEPICASFSSGNSVSLFWNPTRGWHSKEIQRKH